MAQRRNKKLNIPLIKSVFMMVLGFFVAIGSALSGVGAHASAAPMISFLLGYNADRSKGTALAFSLFAAIGGAIGIALAGVHLDFLAAFLVAVGATFGAVLTVRPSLDRRLLMVRRIGQSAGILLAVYVIGEAFRHRIGGPKTFTLEFIVTNPIVGAFIVGAISGALSQLLHVASGIFLVPALVYLVGLRMPEAIGISLTVIALASVLPAISYSSRQSVDQGTGPWMGFGGAIGGFLGGSLLGHLALGSTIPFLIFGLIAMFLSAWSAWRMS